MDFELSEEHKMIQSLVRDFVTGQMRPLERDLLGRAADLSDARTSIPPEKEAELVRMVMDMGLWGVGVPEEFGGVGLDILGICLVEEELAQTIVPFRFGDVSPILFECDHEQRVKYLDPVLRNEKNACLAILEPGPSADISTSTMKAEKGDGGYRLNGRKVSYSRPGENYFTVVFARTGTGFTGFLVDKDTPGFSMTGGTEQAGGMAPVRPPLELVFENCLVPPENVLGAEGQALHLGKQWLPQRRVIRSARSVGIGRRLLEEAVTHAQSLVTFGKPVHMRASIQAALADMATHIHAAALMVYEAAWKTETGKPLSRAAVLVKLHSAQMLQTVADRVSHVFNGPSFVRGLPMERLCRNILQDNAVELALDRLRNSIAADVLKGVRV